MKYVLLIALLFTSGCVPESTKIKIDLMSIAMQYHQFASQMGSPPADAESLASFEDPFGNLPGNKAKSDAMKRSLASGDYIVFWGYDVSADLERNGSVILAYHKDTPSAGGLVAFADGLVRSLTREKFENAAKASDPSYDSKGSGQNSETKQALPDAPVLLHGETKIDDPGTAPKPEEIRPIDVYLAVNDAIRAGDRDTVLNLAAPFMTPAAQKFIDQLNPENAKQFAQFMKNVTAVDGKEFGDLALIVKCDYGDRFTDGLDTDPILLQSVDGQWRLFLPDIFELRSHFSSGNLKTSFDESIRWYQENEPKIRKRLLKDED